MNAIWNQPVLERPPCVTWQIGPLDATKSGVDVPRLKAALATAIHDLESMGDLHLNAAALTRLVYRMKSKFRGDKGLKCMTKLNKALLNYYNMPLKREYTMLRCDLRMQDGAYVLPSRQGLEYVLVRTQGFAKLMSRIEQVAWRASHFLKARIELGHAWSVALVAYATTSRIWFHARNVIGKCCKWYNELYQCAERFQYVGAKPWLPADQGLPRDLKSWLCLDWLDAEVTSSHKLQTWQRIFQDPLIKGIVHDDTKTPRVIADEETDNARLTEVEVASTNDALENKCVSNNDIGEVIDRGAFERTLPSGNRSKATKRKHTDVNERRNLKGPKRKRRKNKNRHPKEKDLL
ncbi:PREDICTED: uncharacterized protein LOC105561140 isoform X2 [Vollenhovia emeryi]|uniref:uncharacterized protein LOC105561140 isoform X2 n=1 Tax=Vollenhovia emeryi TaxID=411798 RepID=UPI0005F39F74|nr:PREDICTED: uncharacterized protein LOC105561140 isoform X2 [Vollenhovia emeryi]